MKKILLVAATIFVVQGCVADKPVALTPDQAQAESPSPSNAKDAVERIELPPLELCVVDASDGGATIPMTGQPLPACDARVTFLPRRIVPAPVEGRYGIIFDLEPVDQSRLSAFCKTYKNRQSILAKNGLALHNFFIAGDEVKSIQVVFSSDGESDSFFRVLFDEKGGGGN